MQNIEAKMSGRITLKVVAEHVGLTPGTVSAVLNNSRAAERIPSHTRERVMAAARELNYQPNPLARALRTGRAVAHHADGSEGSATRGALVILGADQFERALQAMQQAGLRIPGDVSVLDLCDVPAAWEHASFSSAPEYSGMEIAEAPSAA